VNGIYLWGAQLVEGPDKLAYQKVAATQQLVTFTRGSISTRIDPNSYLGSVPYNMLSGSLYLNTNWNILNSPGVTVSYNAGVAPDGNYTATRIQFSGTNKGYYQYPNSVAMAVDLPTTGATFSLSVYVKGNSGESISLAMGGSNSQTVFTMSGYWQRLVYGATAFDNTAGLSINTYNSVTSRDLLVWGAQFVKGGDSLPYLGVTNRLNVPCIDYTTGIGTKRTHRF
ncbi:MAG: hypothetical protein EBS86_14575, partial [Crocinitomicaceae bacterium]|nr:hypothetical protein [Crocinitomicaceae bacterium]